MARVVHHGVTGALGMWFTRGTCRGQADARDVERVINSLSPRRVSVKLVSNSKAGRRGEDDSEKFKGSVGTGEEGDLGE